jgi:Putative Ig domain
LIVLIGNGTKVFIVQPSAEAEMAAKSRQTDRVVVSTPTSNQTWSIGQSVDFTLPASTFTDAQNQPLTLSATLSNGAPLPSWLSFNPITWTFTGIVPSTASGLTIKLTATDPTGQSASEKFSVATPASPPVLTSQTPNQNWIPGQVITFTLASNTFTDPQGETLSYKATQSDGTALPPWLTFNASTETFQGTVPSTLTGIAIKVTATDTSGLSTSEVFSVKTQASAPIVASPTAAQTWALGQPVNFTLTANTFSDPQGEASG